ncbi:MAG: hypothetical protein CME70_22125 [Halobacteriovorax sp.]|nr:hypothetical protein [Halobacteriovorax sp.]|tara:strand:+ start:145622 stop:146581 length:960 start_codon:yes stop_codon:yes gene_type:complete
MVCNLTIICEEKMKFLISTTVILLCAVLMNEALAYNCQAGFNKSELKQFPEEREYQPGVDAGFDQYKTKSLKNSDKVVLTFDDGPHKTRTPRLLDILKKYNVKATFFVLTKLVNDSTRPILERMIKEGHIVATHDHDHDNNNGEDQETFYNELKTSILIIDKLYKKYRPSNKGIFYRFPYGAYGKSETYHHMNVIKTLSYDLYGENCINFAFWDIDSADWSPKLKDEQIAQNIWAHIKGGTAYKTTMKRSIFGKVKYKTKKYQHTWPFGGGVALLHDIHDKSIDAAEIFIKKAKAEGVEIVPLDSVEEYSFKGKTCKID